MNHITPQTALQLKSAGFPQPKIGIDQCWYSGTRFFQITGTDSPLFIYERSNELPEWLAFAPTAEDILQELGAGWGILIVGITDGVPLWCCYYLESGEFSQHAWGKSIAEACAVAYLTLHASK